MSYMKHNISYIVITIKAVGKLVNLTIKPYLEMMGHANYNAILNIKLQQTV